jgi:hypothetical protein
VIECSLSGKETRKMKKLSKTRSNFAAILIPTLFFPHFCSSQLNNSLLIEFISRVELQLEEPRGEHWKNFFSRTARSAALVKVLFPAAEVDLDFICILNFVIIGSS